MQDLRCDVYLLFAGKQFRPKSMCDTLMKLGCQLNERQIKQFKDYAHECKDNPGYTISLSNLECIVVINTFKFAEQTKTELIGTIVHELSHAITMLLEDVGCKDDDELRSIELENVLVQVLQHIGIEQ